MVRVQVEGAFGPELPHVAHERIREGQRVGHSEARGSPRRPEARPEARRRPEARPEEVEEARPDVPRSEVLRKGDPRSEAQ